MIDRREFLKIAAIAGCGLVAGDKLGGLIPLVDASEKYDIVVAKGTGRSPSAITKAAIDAMGGIKSFISRGDIVVIKPNIAWDRLPEQAALRLERGSC